MNRICSAVRRAPPPGKGFKLGRSCTLTRENAIITEMQEIDEIDSVVKDGRGVVGTCDPRKYAESRRVAQVFQELSDKVSGVNVPTVKKRRRMTGRFPRQEDLEGKTASPLRQSSDLKAKGCRFVGRVVSPSACVPQPSPVAQEDFCATTQDIKQESLEKKQESLEKNGKTKAPRTSKNSGDGASKSMHKAGRRKRKHDGEMSGPGDAPSNAQVRKKSDFSSNGSERLQDDCPTIAKRRKIVTFKDEIDVWYYGVKSRRGRGKRNN